MREQIFNIISHEGNASGNLDEIHHTNSRKNTPIRIAIIKTLGTSLVVQWLRICFPMAGNAGLIPGWGTKIPRAAGKLKSFCTREPVRHNEEPVQPTKEKKQKQTQTYNYM